MKRVQQLSIFITGFFTILFFFFLTYSPGNKPCHATEKTEVSGTVTYNGTPVTAMVLANGKYMFTGGSQPGFQKGEFQLADVPFDSNDEITLYAFCSGLAPFKTTLTAGASNYEIEMLKDEGGKQLIVTLDRISGSSTKPGWFDISGTVENESGTALIAMVLANGQYMFTNKPVGEFSLTVPLDGNDEITLYGFCSGLLPSKALINPETVSGTTVTLAEVQAAIEQSGADWIAADNPISSLSVEEKKKLVGLELPADAGITQTHMGRKRLPTNDPNAEEYYTGLIFPEETGDTNAVKRRKAGSDVQILQLPTNYDWRDVNGVNYMTDVKYQGSCGSCWAFATLGAFEGLYSKVYGTALDLSEQILVSCSGAGSCGGGWFAFEYLKNTGVPEEYYFEYQAGDNSCNNALANWEEDTYKISDWEYVTYNDAVSTTIDAIKAALLESPVAATMKVYTDFFYYSGGVYEHVRGDYEGGHAIVIIGWDDSQSCWIAKNSWGTGWGEQGYFKIEYGDSSIAQYSISLSLNTSGEDYYSLLLGTWGMAARCDRADNIAYTETLTFYNDNTVVYEASFPDDVINQVSGTYSLDGDMLRMDFHTSNLEDATLCYQEEGIYSLPITTLNSSTLILDETFELTRITDQEISVTGYWEGYHQKYGHNEEGPDPMELIDMNGIISGDFSCGESNINGNRTGNTFWMEFYDDGNYVYVEGNINGDQMSGTYSFVKNGDAEGTFRTIKSGANICNGSYK